MIFLTYLPRDVCSLWHNMQKNSAIFIKKKKASENARGDISRAGIIFLPGLQLRALLECGFYSREGLIWGNTVSEILLLSLVVLYENPTVLTDL